MHPAAYEARRIDALHGLGLLDTPRDSVFDLIVETAAEVFDTPIAAVSLVDVNRQWFKAIHGLDVCETGRDVAFCSHTIQTPDVMVVEDARKDKRFKDNPLVTGDPYVRFYAGTVLCNIDGYAIGSLCVMDRALRRFPDEERKELSALGRIATKAIQLHERGASYKHIQAELDGFLLEGDSVRG